MPDYPLTKPIAVDIEALQKESFPYFDTLQLDTKKYILDQAGQTVMLFRTPKDGSAGAIYSPYERDKFAAIVDQIKDKALKQNIRTQLQLPPPTDMDARWFKSMTDGLMRDQKKIEAFIAAAQPVNYQPFEFKQEEARGAFQNEYITCSSKSVKHCIGTQGADPCMIMFVRRENKDGSYSEASVGHIDALTGRGSLVDLIPKFDGAKETFDVTVIAANVQRSRGSLLDIIEVLKTPSFAGAVIHADLNHDTTGALIDVATGKIQKNVPINDMGDKEVLELKTKLLALQTDRRGIQLGYDGRQITPEKKNLDMNDIAVPTLPKKTSPSLQLPPPK